MEKNTGKVREFCQSRKVGTLFKAEIQFIRYSKCSTQNRQYVDTVDTCKSGMDSKQRYSSSGIQNVLLKTDSMLTLLIHASPEWIQSKDTVHPVFKMFYSKQTVC